MEEKVQQAQEELASQVQEAPKSLDDVIAGLKGFGIEEVDGIISLKSGPYRVDLRLSNIPTADEMSSLLASEEFKGYLWIRNIKIEILSRAISWIGGRSIRNLKPEERFVPDPTDGNKLKDIQVVLRNLIKTWGQEITETLWRILMVHSQRIEDRLKEAFPDSVVMTDIERRLFTDAMSYVEAVQKEVIEEEAEQKFAQEMANSQIEQMETAVSKKA
jgi:hypothetical protein